MTRDEHNKLVCAVVAAVQRAIKDVQVRDHVAARLQDEYGAWWNNPERIVPLSSRNGGDQG